MTMYIECDSMGVHKQPYGLEDVKKRESRMRLEFRADLMCKKKKKNGSQVSRLSGPIAPLTSH